MVSAALAVAAAARDAAARFGVGIGSASNNAFVLMLAARALLDDAVSAVAGDERAEVFDIR